MRHLLPRRYAEAPADLTGALSIEEEDGRFSCRGFLYILQNQTALAGADLTHAIELANVGYAMDPHDWRNTLTLMLYHLVAGNHTAAERFLQEAFDGNAPIPPLQGAIQDLEELLTVLLDHAQARVFLQRIKAHLASLA